MKRHIFLKICFISILFLMIIIYFYPKDIMNDKTNENLFKVKTPLLFSVGIDDYYLLPKNVNLQYVRSYPEGFTSYKMSFVFEDADLPIVESDRPLYRGGNFVTSPIWVEDIKNDRLMSLINNYPLSKTELRDFLLHS